MTKKKLLYSGQINSFKIRLSRAMLTETVAELRWQNRNLTELLQSSAYLIKVDI